MQFINVGNNTESHNHQYNGHNCSCNGEAESPVNPAQHYGDFDLSEEKVRFESDMPPEVPEISVNGVQLKEAEVLAEMQYYPAASKREAMVKTVEALIIGELLRQKAIELELLCADVEANSIEESAALKALIKQEVYCPKATEQECLRFFEQNTAKFTTSPLLEVRHILLAADPEDFNERAHLKELAQSLIKQVTEAPASFKSLVKLHSSCPSKQQEGNLGQISQGQTVKEFEQALFAAEEGVITYPVETRYGFHIVMVDRKVPGQALPYDYVKDKVTDYLNDKVERKATAQYIQTLVNEVEIKGFNFDFEASPLMQ